MKACMWLLPLLLLPLVASAQETPEPPEVKVTRSLQPSVITGFAGFLWGTSRGVIEEARGEADEVVTDAALTVLIYRNVEGPSGLETEGEQAFLIHAQHGLTSGVTRFCARESAQSGALLELVISDLDEKYGGIRVRSWIDEASGVRAGWIDGEGIADLSGLRFAEIWVRTRPDAPRCVETEYTDSGRLRQIDDADRGQRP